MTRIDRANKAKNALLNGWDAATQEERKRLSVAFATALLDCKPDERATVTADVVARIPAEEMAAIKRNAEVAVQRAIVKGSN